MMKTINIDDTQQLIDLINSLPNHYIYRGQANAEWSLTSSLERIVGHNWTADKAKKFEERSLSIFQSKFHLYDLENHAPSSKLAWLAAMQHYGVPTRLLDFSESPYVALYFALETFNYVNDNDLALYVVDYKSIIDETLEFIRKQDSQFPEDKNSIQGKQDEIFEKFVDRFSRDIVWITEPAILNTRIDRQSGCFLLSGNMEKKIEDLLISPLYRDTDIQKIIIPGCLAQAIYALLRKMNLTSKNLYGDLEGLAKSIRMEIQVYAS